MDGAPKQTLATKPFSHCRIAQHCALRAAKTAKELNEILHKQALFIIQHFCGNCPPILCLFCVLVKWQTKPAELKGPSHGEVVVLLLPCLLNFVKSSKTKRDSLIRQFRSITNATQNDASRLLKQNGYRLEASIDAFYSDSSALANASKANTTDRKSEKDTREKLGSLFDKYKGELESIGFEFVETDLNAR